MFMSRSSTKLSPAPINTFLVIGARKPADMCNLTNQAMLPPNASTPSPFALPHRTLHHQAPPPHAFFPRHFAEWMCVSTSAGLALDLAMVCKRSLSRMFRKSPTLLMRAHNRNSDCMVYFENHFIALYRLLKPNIDLSRALRPSVCSALPLRPKPSTRLPHSCGGRAEGKNASVLCFSLKKNILDRLRIGTPAAVVVGGARGRMMMEVVPKTSSSSAAALPLPPSSSSASSSLAQPPRRRPGVGAKKLAPLEDGPATGSPAAAAAAVVKPRKIFTKKDLVESVRKMAVRGRLVSFHFQSVDVRLSATQFNYYYFFPLLFFLSLLFLQSLEKAMSGWLISSWLPAGI